MSKMISKKQLMYNVNRTGQPNNQVSCCCKVVTVTPINIQSIIG